MGRYVCILTRAKEPHFHGNTGLHSTLSDCILRSATLMWKEMIIQGI